MSAVDYTKPDATIPTVADVPIPTVAESADPQEPAELTPLEFAARVYNRVLILFVLYVLSIGPAFWLWMKSMYLEENPVIAAFYYPLLLLCEWIPPFEELVNWYIKLWWS